MEKFGSKKYFSLLILLIFLCQACVSTTTSATSATSVQNRWVGITYNGENTYLLEGTSWLNHYDSPNGGNSGSSNVEFRSGGRMRVFDSDYTWQREGNNIKFVRNDGWSHYEGTYDPVSRRITGHGLNSSNFRFSFTMELLPNSPIPGGGIEGALARAATEVSENFTRNSRLAIVYITTQERGTTEFIIGELEHILRRQGFFIVDRTELNRVRAEQQFGMTGEVDDNTAARIGHIAGASIVITGRVDGDGNLRRLRLRALDTTSAQVVGTASERL